jgi:uncharacterized protein (TIGR02453 family)
MAKAAADGFAGFKPAALTFFRQLAANQDRVWFQEHRDAYEREVLSPLRALVAELATVLPRRGVPLTAGDPAKAIFRIHRDVRFSRDKTPYKTHAGAVLSRDGTKNAFGLLYIHVDPTGSFAAAGFWQPAPPHLEALRISMVEEPERLLAAIDAVRRGGGDIMREDALTRLPRGFEHAAGTPVVEHVKLRHLIAQQTIPATALRTPELVERIAAFAVTAKPLLEFGWDAL